MTLNFLLVMFLIANNLLSYLQLTCLSMTITVQHLDKDVACFGVFSQNTCHQHLPVVLQITGILYFQKISIVRASLCHCITAVKCRLLMIALSG